ncbi:P-loop containing nucleoside triphosphate hydrolase protein [Xylariaceae sp. FL0255]|nr:P-loop containing nucleoside triphosphate hydrolase protein [Xylariaceae sp. FL0255]
MATATQSVLVKGKGRGLIILLHGVPGVGKTSTAETIAEATGRPLLPVTCGDIGETAIEVERNLEQIFTNSHRWGCVLLLDEAEVFLTKRNLQDIQRNAMVSVFLRALEFYSGILFLTTNRVGSMDEAFKSRIHISLHYKMLDWDKSKQIWEVNLKRAEAKVDVETERKAIMQFAKNHFKNSNSDSRWNGQQIFNAVKTAVALAEFRGQRTKSSGKPQLTAQDFKLLSQVAHEFDEYLCETRGGVTVAEKMVDEYMRANEEKPSEADKPNSCQKDSKGKSKKRSRKHCERHIEDTSSSEELSESDSDPQSGSSSEESDSEAEEKKMSKKKGRSLSWKKQKEQKASKSKKPRTPKGETDDEESSE